MRFKHRYLVATVATAGPAGLKAELGTKEILAMIKVCVFLCLPPPPTIAGHTVYAYDARAFLSVCSRIVVSLTCLSRLLYSEGGVVVVCLVVLTLS